MKWSLLELNKYQERPLEFEEVLDVKQSLMNRDKQILDITSVKVNGMLTVEKSGYLLFYKLTTILTVPSSRSLDPVELPLELTVDEVFMTKEQFQGKDERLSAEEIILLDTETIDLTESVEDNILLGIPLQVLSKAEKESKDMPKGNDWEVISEEEYVQQREIEATETIDPRLAKLSELLNDDLDD
ncbi:YceD family protein [Enterococcus sp. LJL128]|uniref:YceD family protein n=1 Tax=Enterococcus sp. LJL51 TaxID=3416656 RepID=UPI003CEBA41D